MSKINTLHGVLSEIEESLRLADDEIDSLIKIKHPKRYSQDEYEQRFNRKK